MFCKKGTHFIQHLFLLAGDPGIYSTKRDMVSYSGDKMCYVGFGSQQGVGMYQVQLDSGQVGVRFPREKEEQKHGATESSKWLCSPF